MSDPTELSESGDKAAETKTNPEAAETQLPEIKLEQVAKSEEIIVDNEHKLNSAVFWREFTIVTTQEKGGKIQVIDAKGHRREDFDHIAQKGIKIDWLHLKRLLDGSSGIQQNDAGRGTNYKEIKNLPHMFRDPVQLALSSSQSDYRNYESMPPAFVDLTVKEPVMLEHGKYLIFERDYGYLAFVTLDDQNVPLPPRNWKRYENIKWPSGGQWMRPEEPSDLIKQVLRVSKRRELNDRYKNQRLDAINEKYGLITNDNGFNVTPIEDYQAPPLFSDSLIGAKDFFLDPNNHNVVYYYLKNQPKEIYRLDTGKGEPKTWQAEVVSLPPEFKKVGTESLNIDPTGNFIYYNEGDELVFIDRTTFKEVQRIPGVVHAKFDEQGNIRAFDQEGHLVVSKTNLKEISSVMGQRKLAAIAAGLTQDLFRPQVSGPGGAYAENQGSNFESFLPIKEKFEAEFEDQFNRASTRDDVVSVGAAYTTLRARLQNQNIDSGAIDYITSGILEKYNEKLREFDAKIVQDALARVEARLQGGSLSISDISDARADLSSISQDVLHNDEELKQRFEAAQSSLKAKSKELFEQQGKMIQEQLAGLVAGARAELDGFTSKLQFDEWDEYRYPNYRGNLGQLQRECPLELQDASKAISSASEQLQKLRDEYHNRFLREYAEVRQKAADRREGIVGQVRADITALLDRIRTKGFKKRDDAESYLISSESYKLLLSEIDALKLDDPDAAEELDKSLKVQIANVLSEIERMGKIEINETGKQYELFGDYPFPKWEAKVKEKAEREVELVFLEDSKTRGPRVNAKAIQGDMGLRIKTSDGVQTVRLYEGWEDENEWRLGLLTSKGAEVPPSYLEAGEFQGIKSQYRKWRDKGSLYNDWEAQRRILRDLSDERPKIKDRENKEWQNKAEDWSGRYEKALKDYGSWCMTNNIALFRRIDTVGGAPELEHSNGKGYVPEWQPHWVQDADTEKYLEHMARDLRMQMDLQEGILDLKGHAGTGKDVLVKMFCNRTNRPYFSVDCSKWTTEFELSEDVVLESKDGASYTLKVPSQVLNAITTPGGVLYFNEINAMPEQAQIFLHSLLDEKRSLSLKTSSGQVIKAHPSVLLLDSRNPGYPGTFDPQFATKSRMVSLEIAYPKLETDPKPGEQNKNPRFNASEPLRIARQVKSLSGMTYEPSMDRNGFVRQWDRVVNGDNNNAEELTGTQKFDLDTILALVQFSDRLRENFLIQYEGNSSAKRTALPVKQPITGREMRRCAYMLSQMTDEQKLGANPEETARNLLATYFISHLDSEADKEKITTSMNSWTSSKRVAV
jgi:hypothetical protein